MKRPNGLDKNGRPMTVRGGVVDLLEGMEEGGLLLAYCGGLHHVQAPGSGFPKLGKRIAIRFERTDIATYLAQFPAEERREAIPRDLERRRDLHCPAQV